MKREIESEKAVIGAFGKVPNEGTSDGLLCIQKPLSGIHNHLLYFHGQKDSAQPVIRERDQGNREKLSY